MRKNANVARQEDYKQFLKEKVRLDGLDVPVFLCKQR